MDFHSEIKRNYEYLKDHEIDRLINKAKSILINQLYPADLSVDYLTYDVPVRFHMWILDCVDEMISTSGFSHFTSYSENGVSWKKINDYSVSEGLLSQVQRLAGVAK